MQVRIKDDSVEIDGYVNAVERKSRPLKSRIGKFVERIKKGAFKRALERADDVRILENHDWDKDLGGIKDGNLELTEDNIGLRARAILKGKEAVEKARRGDYIGWSFGFKDRDGGVETRTDENGLTLRDVSDLDLYEVSLIDRTKRPAYEGTLVTVRSEDDVQYRGESLIDEVVTRDETEKKEEPKQADYSYYDKIMKELKEDF